jgi:transcriptional regulator with XRE-family HTH domain
MKSIGQKIRLLRQNKGWSQEAAANLLHISTPAFSKIETGITDVTLSRLEEISAVFGLTAAQLLSLDDNGRLENANLTQELLSKRLDSLDIEKIEIQEKLIKLYEAIRQVEREARAQPAGSP